MAERFPEVRIDANVLYVEDGNLLTSAGTASSLDACLHVLRQRLGAAVANRVARRLVISPHREGGQAQCIEQPLPETAGATRLARLVESVRGRLTEPHSVDSLAAEASMSRRSFTRHFKALTGTTVQAWLLGERLAEIGDRPQFSEAEIGDRPRFSGKLWSVPYFTETVVCPLFSFPRGSREPARSHSHAVERGVSMMRRQRER
jgi:transcriptional regulator GlxA family with amidase domain